MVGQPATEIAASVRAGSTSARDVVAAHLNLIDRVDGELGAYQLVRRETALREASELDGRADLAALPLAGVPVAIKDNVDVAGTPTRNGSRATDPSPRPADHETVRRLRSAGAIVVGKTSVPEMCVWGRTDGAFGITHNPWDLERTCGGSSGGSAAAVAAGLVPLALGADGMGSIRIPSAACGIVGLKPGTGLVPGGLGADDWFGMSENGAMASTVADVAAMMAVLADRQDLAAVQEPGQLRIAVSAKSPLPGVRVTRAIRRALGLTWAALAAQGHEVDERDPPYSPRITFPATARWCGGVAADAHGRDRRSLERRTRGHIRLGHLLERAGFLAEPKREWWRAAMDRFFEEADLLVTPALARKPPRASAWSKRSWIRNVLADSAYAPFAAPWNLAALPAMSVPAGTGPDGLPLAVQFVGDRGSESLLLAVAHQIEAERPWPRHAPMPFSTSPTA